MPRDPQALRRVIGEYGRPRRLEGCTPQAGGQRFNALIADALRCWGIDATPNVLSAGEVDVVFAVDGVRNILEAKWEKDRTDTGKIAKLQKRVRQRLAGTDGVMLSMSGYTPATLNDVKDGERLEVLLLDEDHWEAMLADLIPPGELFSLVRDHPYTPVPGLFSAARVPQLSSLTSKTASSRHGCPGPRTPPTNWRTVRALSARPATVMLSPIPVPVICAPPFRPSKC